MRSVFGASSKEEPRRPRFLSGTAPVSRQEDAAPAFVPGTQADGILQRLAETRAPAPANEPPSSQPLQAGEIDRVAEAVVRLQLRGAQLAEEARADVLELAFAMAKRILETELHASHDALFALVRSAVRRVGEARRIEVRVSPADAEPLREAIESGGASLVTLTPVTVVADASLQPGDCTVDSDAGAVDGRLASRLGELRDAIEAAAEETAA